MSTKFHERRYLIVPYSEYEDDIFESEELEFIDDIVLIKDVGDAYEFWTNKFVGENNHTEPIFLDVWFKNNESFYLEGDLYPDKIIDQQGRALRISTFDYKPYINLDSRQGIEFVMALEYAKLHNMTTEIIVESEFWGVIFEENYTATGAKLSLWSDKADISIGSWYRLPHYTHFFDLTETTVRIGVTFIVPAPEQISGWFTPMFAFSTDLWIGFALCYIFLSLALFSYEYFYKKYIQNRPRTLHFAQSFEITLITLFLQQAKDFFQTRKKYLRQIVTNILLASLLFAAVYNAGFAVIMTYPSFGPSIKNSEDLDASGIKWGAIHPALLDGFKELKKYQHVVQNIEIRTNEQIRNLMHERGYAILADRVPNGLVIADRIDYRDVQYYRVISDDLYWDHCIILAKRSSVLIPSIRKAFLSMKEGGLLYPWELQALFEENFKAQIAFANQKIETTIEPLQWKHVQGAFGVLWIGLIISTFAFIWETKIKDNVHLKFHKYKIK